MSNGMFNRDQREHMEYLATIPLERRCYCRWYRLGECPHSECASGRTGIEGRLDHARTMHERNKFHVRTAEAFEECMDELCAAVREPQQQPR